MLRFSPMLLLAALVGCGGKAVTLTVTESRTVTVTAPAQATQVRVYFLRDGKVAPVARSVPATRQLGAEALAALFQGPTTEEQDEGLTTALPAGEPTQAGLAQIVYTLTQFPGRPTAELGGKSYTRADFEDVTPAILVESPLPGETVTSPLHASGTANTFEATFEYDLTDPDGKIVAHHFVTATSGSGTRGTFDFTAPFHVDRAGLGELIVYERSAADGSRIHISEIPIQLEP